MSGIKNGAIGGKLIGAGGEDFIILTENKLKLKKKCELGLKETKFSFEHEGAKIINNQ